MYCIEKYLIEEHLTIVMKRLYSETRFKNGDEMRDMAQLLQAIKDGAIEIEE